MTHYFIPCLSAIGALLASLGLAGLIFKPAFGTMTFAFGSIILLFAGVDFLIAALWRARYIVLVRERSGALLNAAGPLVALSAPHVSRATVSKGADQ